MQRLRLVLLTAVLCQWCRGQQRGESPLRHPRPRLLIAAAAGGSFYFTAPRRDSLFLLREHINQRILFKL